MLSGGPHNYAVPVVSLKITPKSFPSTKSTVESNFNLPFHLVSSCYYGPDHELALISIKIIAFAKF